MRYYKFWPDKRGIYSCPVKHETIRVIDFKVGSYFIFQWLNYWGRNAGEALYHLHFVRLGGSFQYIEQYDEKLEDLL